MSVGILGEEREPGLGKLGWHGNFDRELKVIFRSKSRVRVFVTFLKYRLLYYSIPTLVKQSFFLRFDNIIHYEFPDKVQRRLQRQKQVYAYLGLCLMIKDKKTIL